MRSRAFLIIFDGFTKFFKATKAVEGLQLEIADQEVFGLLGPNGAGKTTIVLTMCSILKPSRGTIRLNGVDVSLEPDKARRQLGVAFQEPVLDTRLTVEQNLEFHAHACGLSRDLRRTRIRDVLTDLEIWKDRNQKAGKLSGGMKKKVEDAKVFVQKPRIAVFDEPTAYLDVPSRHTIWKDIQNLKDDGSTIVLATNMMDEAEQVCNRVGILSKGSLVAVGPPDKLKDALPRGDVIEIRVGDVERAMRCLRNMSDVREVAMLRPSNKLRVYVGQAELKLPKIMEALIREEVRVESIEVKEPSLDDVFLHFTGETL